MKVVFVVIWLFSLYSCALFVANVMIIPACVSLAFIWICVFGIIVDVKRSPKDNVSNIN